jgi:hypothetical protein
MIQTLYQKSKLKHKEQKKIPAQAPFLPAGKDACLETEP